MAVRNIVKIDREKCNGCGKCVTACAEGAIRIVNGKAELISENYCDGLGACLGTCPMDAITVEKREAEDFDEAAVKEHLAKQKGQPQGDEPPCMCPSMTMFDDLLKSPAKSVQEKVTGDSAGLTNWPIQLQLVNPQAPVFKGKDLLLVADCVAFALPDFHARFLQGDPVIIGCPKLDETGPYVEKLAEIFRSNETPSVKIVHMVVPCCHGLIRIAEAAKEMAGSGVQLEEIVVDVKGQIVQTKNP